MTTRRPPAAAVASMIGLALLAASCSSVGSDGRLAAVEGRLANLEGRMVAIDGGDGALGEAPGSDAGNPKQDLDLVLDPQVLQDAIAEETELDVEVVELDLDPLVDLIMATIRPIQGSEDDVAWEAAKALAPLFTDLGDYAPALDLRVGETRCICSTQLMKRIAAGSAVRADWAPACTT